MNALPTDKIVINNLKELYKKLAIQLKEVLVFLPSNILDKLIKRLF